MRPSWSARWRLITIGPRGRPSAAAAAREASRRQLVPSGSAQSGPGSPRGRAGAAAHPRSGGAADGALKLRLAHLRAPLDAEAACFCLELLAGRRVASADGRGLLAERGPGLAREVLEGLLTARSRLRLL